MTAAAYDADGQLLNLTFSEAVQWSALAATNFQITGAPSFAATNNVGGAQASTTTASIPCTQAGTDSGLGSLLYLAAPAQIVSTATGLPLAAFSGRTVVITH